MTRAIAVVLTFLLPQALPSTLFAQAGAQPGVLQGTIVDPDGKAVAGAAVSVRSETTGDARAAVTGADGRFSVIVPTPPGAYTLEIAATGFATARRQGLRPTTDGHFESVAITLAIAGLSEQVSVQGDLPAAARIAPSQGSLTARSAQSEISEQFIRNFTSPVADYSQVIQMAPGTFSVSPNGVGLGDTKTFFRGFKDGQYSMTFDGIPFNDTNDPTHHSWAFFPSQFLGGTVFDRSPGSAATVGPSTFGGSVHLLSRTLQPQQQLAGSVSYGSFATRLLDAEYGAGRFGPGGRSRLLLDVHQLSSDGYQTYNHQRRNAFSGKYELAATDRTTLTFFTGIVDLRANTPNTKGPTRAQIAQFGDDYLLSGDPADANYVGYNFYHVPTDFEYVGVRSDLGGGWTIDGKAYTYRYYNKQNYNSATTISATSATDKLNSYRKVGGLMPVSQSSSLGTFRAGVWYEYAWTDRFQTPSDPRTWVDAALPNFHEKFNTTTAQPFAEYQFKATSDLTITPGIKLAYFKQDFTQFADNGKTVGNLNGLPSVSHAAEYHTWLPSFDVHYMLRHNWSAYGQYGKGNNIPPTSVFDVKSAQVATLPKPTLTDTYQFGSVWKSNHFTLDVDAYRVHFENDYSSAPDPETGEPVYFLTGTSVTKGVEAESTVLVGRGVSVYVNGTLGSAKYKDTGLWVQNAPRDTETLGLAYQRDQWNVALYNKRVGRLFNDNGDTHEAVAISPFNLTNLFVNYTLRNASRFSQTRFRFSVNNLFDKHSITGVTPASTKTSLPAPGDTLTLLAARSVSMTMSVGWTPRP